MFVMPLRGILSNTLQRTRTPRREPHSAQHDFSEAQMVNAAQRRRIASPTATARRKWGPREQGRARRSFRGAPGRMETPRPGQRARASLPGKRLRCAAAAVEAQMQGPRGIISGK